MDKLFTPEQVAELLNMSIHSVRRWLRVGILQGIKVGERGQWRVSPEALEKFIESRRTGGNILSEEVAISVAQVALSRLIDRGYIKVEDKREVIREFGSIYQVTYHDMTEEEAHDEAASLLGCLDKEES